MSGLTRWCLSDMLIVVRTTSGDVILKPKVIRRDKITWLEATFYVKTEKMLVVGIEGHARPRRGNVYRCFMHYEPKPTEFRKGQSVWARVWLKRGSLSSKDAGDITESKGE